MAVIRIYGLPEETTEDQLKSLHKDLTSAATSISTLGLSEKSISCFFPKDMMKFGLGEEIVVYIDFLSFRPSRNVTSRAELVSQIGQTLKQYFPKALVECFIMPFDPERGYWFSDSPSLDL